MACHPAAPFSDEQVALIDSRVRDQIIGSVRHCSICGTSPIGRVVACTEVGCPARVPEAA